MDEKILIKSEHYSLKKFLIIVLALTVLASLIWFIVWYAGNVEGRKDTIDHRWEEEQEIYSIRNKEKNCEHSTMEDRVFNESAEFYKKHPTFESYAKCRNMYENEVYQYTFSNIYGDAISDPWLLMTLIPLSLNLITLYIWFLAKGYSLTITDKRAYGNTSFGKQVDLPMDSISAVATSWLNGISIATSSGRISFLLIKNRDEIHKTLSDLIIARQTKPKTEGTKATKEEPATIIQQASAADELKKFKDLLDAGVITQEEFDAKKKQILGL